MMMTMWVFSEGGLQKSIYIAKGKRQKVQDEERDKDCHGLDRGVEKAESCWVWKSLES